VAGVTRAGAQAGGPVVRRELPRPTTGTLCGRLLLTTEQLLGNPGKLGVGRACHHVRAQRVTRATSPRARTDVRPPGIEPGTSLGSAEVLYLLAVRANRASRWFH
jgi:hypothetical protein